MPKEVVIPQLANEIDEAEIDEWITSVGQRVTLGDQLLSITTPKLTMEIEAPANGVLSEIKVAAGELVKTGDVIAIIDDD